MGDSPEPPDPTGAPAAPRGGREPVHQVLGPAADLGHPPEAVDVVVQVGRVGADVDMATRPHRGACALGPEDRADALQLSPGLRGVAEDRAHHLPAHRDVALHRPHPWLSTLRVIALLAGAGGKARLVKSTSDGIGISAVELDLHPKGLVRITDHVLSLVLGGRGGPGQPLELAVELLVVLEQSIAFRDLLPLLAQELLPEMLGLLLFTIDALLLLLMANASLGVEPSPARGLGLGLLLEQFRLALDPCGGPVHRRAHDLACV